MVACSVVTKTPGSGDTEASVPAQLLPIMAVPSGASHPTSLSQTPCLGNRNGNSSPPCRVA